MKKGWEITNINDVCSLQNGFAFKSKDYSSSGARVIRITNVQNGYIADNNPRYMALESLSDYERFKINHDDILLSLTGDVGRVGRFPKDLLPALLNQRVSRLENINEKRILKDFMFFFLNSHIFEDNAVATAKGAAQKNISTKSIGAFQIPIPPLSEQEEIVEVLDTAFAAIDQAKANIEQNIANAKELFQSKLNQIFSQKGEGWVDRTFSECLRLKSGDGLTSKNMVPGDYPVYGGNRIAGYHNESNLSKEHVIIGRVGALCGNARYIDEPIWLTDNAFKVSSMHSDFDLEFLTYMLNFKNLRSYARQAAQPVISNSSLKKVALSFPEDTKTQKDIAHQLDALSESSRQLESHYQTKLDSLNELKKSILQKAFVGELT